LGASEEGDSGATSCHHGAVTFLSALPPRVRPWLLVAAIGLVNTTIGLLSPSTIGPPYFFAALSVVLLLIGLTRALIEYRRREVVAGGLAGQGDRRR
jgi:hypothetical protein